MDSRLDDILHTVIQQKGQGVHGFLDVLFGFLYRRTDFFYEMAPGENMGFFPNQAEALVCGFFRKYQSVHYKDRVPKRNIDPKEIEEFMKKAKDIKDGKLKEIADKKEEKKVETSVKKEEKKVEQLITGEKKEEKKGEVKEEDVSLTKNTLPEKEIEPKFAKISTYNGDACENYNWNQGSKDVQIQIDLKPNTTSKTIKVEMTTSHLKVRYKDSEEDYFNAEFCEKIDPSESNWTIEDGKFLVLFLDKAQELIWKSAFKGHKEIDTKKVDNSKKLNEFDNDTQAALNKIIYEQNRKKNGLPTTEEEKKLEALKEAWNKPDSPFRGQEFDPSQFNLNEPMYFNTPDYEAKLRWKKNRKNS